MLLSTSTNNRRSGNMNLPKFSTGIRWKVVLSVLVLLAVLAGVLTTYTKFTELQEDNATLSTKLEKQSETLDKLLVDNNNLTENVKNLDLAYKKALEENRQVTEKKVVLETSLKQLEEKNKQLLGRVAGIEKENARLKSANNAIKAEAQKQQRQVRTTSKATSSYTSVSRGTKNSGKKIMVSATAYTAYCNGCSGTTATGINLRENPSAKVIAVDPNVIPLGTKVYVDGYGYAIAGDTGGAIKGNKIDLFMESSSEAYSWGRRTVALTILE